MKKFNEITIGDTLYTCDTCTGKISKFIVMDIINFPDCYYFKMNNEERYWYVSKSHADETFSVDTATSKDKIKQVSIGIIRNKNLSTRNHRRFLRNLKVF